MSDMSDAYREMVLEKLAALEKERDRTLTDWREYKASKDADVAAWKTKADATADERDAALADNAALLAAIHLPTLRFAAEVLGAKQPDVRRRLEELMLRKNRPHPGAALLKEHRKALVRARNDGLEKAARETDAEADEWDGAAAHDGEPVSHEANAIRGAARRIRALKEPES